MGVPERSAERLIMRFLVLLFVLISSAFSESIGDGYFATSNGDGGDRVVPFGDTKPKEYFKATFLAAAPHTKTLVGASTSIKPTWTLVGYTDGKPIYDLVHSIQAYGGEWAVKTILLETEKGLFRPLFCRMTLSAQWPITDTLFAITDGSLSLVDRYRENAKISGPYGHVLVAKKHGWVVEGFTKHPQLFKNE